MIYGFKSCKSFYEFKLFILVRTFVKIHYHRTLEFVGSLNLHWRSPNFGILVLKSISTSWISATVAGFRPTSAWIWSFAPNFGHCCWNMAQYSDSGDSCWNPVVLCQILAKRVRIWPFGPNSDSHALCQIPAIWPVLSNSSHNCQNLVTGGISPLIFFGTS